MVASPQEIQVRLPWAQIDSSSERPIPIFTSLFRPECFQAESLNQMYTNNPNADEYTILVGACSIAAGADSLAALHNKSGNLARLRVLGLDRNPKAIQIAKAGKYILSSYEVIHNANRLPLTIETLTEYGFLDDGGEQSKEITEDRANVFAFDSTSVRQGHKIDFSLTNLSCGELPEIKADLVEACNVLYHLSPSEAWKVVDRLAGLLSENGVLNLSGERSDVFRSTVDKAVLAGKKIDDVASVSYPEWQEITAHYLETHFGLHRIQPDTPQLFMFSK